MKSSSIYATAVAALASTAAAAKESRTFAVLRFNGDGPLMEGRVDPIVMQDAQSPSAHVHTVLGASNFGFSVSGPQLRQSSCTNAKIVGDMSNYWYPKVYFHDKATNTFEPVDMFYTNVYYFFDKTRDQIKAFPLGMRMVAGNATTRVAPALKGDTKLTAPGAQPASWTCPRSTQEPPAWPLDSDGSMAGFQSTNNKGEGTGFPFAECDGYASPLRADVHFPSCYNPAAGINNYKTNTAYPSDVNGYWDCPAGWIHTPHLFLEVYWNTPKFADRWTPNQGSQPFVLSNGDRTGFSSHADFVSGWDETVLQGIIDNCDAGTAGMDKCPGVQVYPDNTKCKITSPVNEVILGKLSALPGNNPLAGWGVGNVNVGVTNPAPAPDTGSGTGTTPSSSSSAPAAPATSSTAPAGSGSGTGTGSGSGSGGNGDGYGGGGGSEAEVTPTTQAAEVTPAPSFTSKVVTTTDAQGKPTQVTVWETVTAWVTTTVYEDGPSPTAAAIATPTSAPSAGAVVAGFTFAGCYEDHRDARVIVGEKFPNLGGTTNAKCVAYCKGKGYSVAGTENGGQCFCGNAVVGSAKKPDSDCSAPCEGDASGVDKCGAADRLSVYSSDGTIAPAGAGAAKAKRHVQLHQHQQGAHRRRADYSPRRRR